MTARTSMPHAGIDEKLTVEASEKLASVGLTISDAARILLTRVAGEGRCRPGIQAPEEARHSRFRAKVQEALADTRQTVPHHEVMNEAQALIDRKRASS
ncbi:antitoxin PaaA2 family protein [Phreatobacter sp. AB_2022a]|uniref:antitoxin PaaA2 family protein n=1 Tax=Phreatobacter sp. AB_2022a TaxID=3003134 RepID=UPI00228752CC|nr:type II toxin-antitoxin system RelB/DinJ family antitoxin [Phreatobacter sp. AB_2022a]MCZ0735066.1 type II toxin-antitoxin system RelB/DinJ family antitoxin [Phreatobacter sp. AB_2022a]